MDRKARLIGASIVVLAIVARAAAVLVLRTHDVPRSTYEHGEIAANLLAGKGFAIAFLGGDGPTSQQAPIYPVVVAAAYAIGGVETPRALLILELSQAVLGGGLAWGVIRLAQQVAPGRFGVAVVAGLLAALHPTLVYAATHVQVAGLGATLLVWTLVWAYRAGASGEAADAAITGGFLAATALTDPILALGGLGIVWAYGQASGDRGRTVRLLICTLAVALLGIAPWLARNYRIHGEFVAIKSTFGYAFWQGNCRLSEGTDKVRRASAVDAIQDASDGPLSDLNRGLWRARHIAGYLDDIALTADDRRQLGRVTEPERSRILFRRAVDDLKADPWRYPRLCLRRLRYFVFFDETNPKTWTLLYRVPHVGLTLLAIAGLILADPATHRRLVPTLVVAAAIAVFHALTIVSARFHIPIEPMMAIWAGAGLSRWSLRPAQFLSAAGPHHVERVGIEGGLELVCAGGLN